jgi:hypothetical protein
MISVNGQKNLLVEIGNRLPKEMIAYAIGGTAMMFLGFKEATKDIDLVFTSEEDRKRFKDIAQSLGYKEMDSVIVYGVKNNRPIMISLGDSRLDLFFIDVIDFTFSENMQKRAANIHQFGKNLILKIADKHDIILMKCATNRIRDEDDIVNIVKNSEIDWNILIEEAKNQVKLGREQAFLDMGSLAEKLINKHKLNVPKQIGDTLFDLLKKQADEKKKAYDRKTK